MAFAERSTISPLLVGRNQEVALAERALQSTLQGSGDALLIAGDAGVGKSRFLAEISTRAVPLGYWVMQAHCFEQDISYSYSLWIDALRSHFAVSPPSDFSASFGPFAAEVQKLLPGIGPLLSTVLPATNLDPEMEKRRLFEALAYFLTTLAQSHPLLLIVEDIHWSDKSSLDFLHFFLRRITNLPILLLISYRQSEVSPSLQHFLAQLDRERLAHELVLTPLARSAVEQMVGTILATTRPVHFELLDAIYTRTEGNAFFVEEMLKLLMTAGELQSNDGCWELKPPSEWHVPRSLIDTVQRRTTLLTPTAKELLAVAAVIGRRFDFALLQALLDLSEESLLSLLKELLASQLIVEETSEQFAFRHALTREAVYASILRRERRHYHQRIFDTLNRLYAATIDRHLDALAYHAFEAALWQQAIDFSQRAGEQAWALCGAREAIVHFNRAIDASRQLDQSPPPEVLRGRGKAFEMVGDFELARLDYERTLEAATARDDGVAKWQALLDLGSLWAGDDYARTGDYFQRALNLARTLNQPQLIAHSLNRVGNWHANVEQRQAALAYHVEALAFFESLNDRRGLAETYDLLGMLYQLSSNLHKSYDAFQRAIVLWRALQDRPGLISSLASLPLCTASYLKNLEVPALSLTEAANSAREALKLAQEIGWRAGEAFADIIVAMCLGAQGEFGQAMEAAQAGLRCAEEIEHRQWVVGAHTALGILYSDYLVFDKAIVHLEKSFVLAQAVGSSVWSGSNAGCLASVFVASGALAKAQSLLNETLSPATPMQLQEHRLCWYAQAEVALATGDASTALKITEQLQQAALNLAPDGIIPRLGLLNGKSLSALGKDDAAARLMQAAYQAAVAQGALPLQWQLALALGKVLQSQVRRDDAEKTFDNARKAIQELAQRIPAGLLRDTFVERAMAMLPSSPVLTATQLAKQQSGGLTAREREIAQLVGQGKSNQEIADELFVGVRTVEAHITRILNKLDFNSRVQIAAWVVEKRLTSGRATENS